MPSAQPDVGGTSAEAAYLDDHVFHVVKLLWMKEGRELAPRGDAVGVSVGRPETPFVSGEHGFIRGLVFYVIKVLSCKESRHKALWSDLQELLLKAETGS